MGDLWNALIFDPMLNSLIILYTFLGNNFGLTIIVFTLIVNIIMLPLRLKQIRSTKKLAVLGPRLQAVSKKYANDSQRRGQETMRIYKEEGISPLGCLGPLVIQMPVWISLYWCIYALIPTFPENFASLTLHMYDSLEFLDTAIPLNSRFLGLDLAQPVALFALLVGGSMWVLQKMSTMESNDPRQQQTQKMMLWMMPFMFGFLCLQFPSGLSMYWMTSNLVGIAVQYFVAGWGGLSPNTNTSDSTKINSSDNKNEEIISSEEEPVNEKQYPNKREDSRRRNRNSSNRTRRKQR
jgi:YidC/Oxa1 family membrane protein insertase